jgi:hypothetical protein
VSNGIDEIHSALFEGRPMRFIRGPRFDGDLPWWVAEDLTGCIAELLGRPHLGDVLLRRLLEECPAEDQAVVLAADGAGEIDTVTAVAELELVPMIMALSEAGSDRLAAFGEWFTATGEIARRQVGGDVAVACSRRGIPLDDEEDGA